MANKPDDLRIGDFAKPVVGSPTETALKQAEKRLDDAASKDEATLKPMASYEERLVEVGITKAKAAEIIDAVLLKGFYAEDVQLTKSVRARFRTRSARDTRRIQEMLEAQRLTLDVHYQETMTRFLLAASLESFGTDKLEHVTRKATQEAWEKAFSERINFVDGLSDPAMRLLFQKLYKFDKMITAALDEGSIENF